MVKRLFLNLKLNVNSFMNGLSIRLILSWSGQDMLNEESGKIGIQW